jgi:uncharacterized membrane protein YphA (DoxX/SURF4 family)
MNISDGPVPSKTLNSFRTTSRAFVSFLRIYLGVILFITVLGKLTRDEPFATEMLGFLGGVVRRGAFPWYTAFIQQVVVPHASLFSYLVMTGELFAAISLLTGAITRLGALMAMSLFLNYMLAKARMFWSPDSEDAAVFFIALVVFLGRAGRVWGVDALLAKRWPRSWLW